MQVYYERLDGSSAERFAYDLKDAFQLLSTLCIVDTFSEAIITDSSARELEDIQLDNLNHKDVTDKAVDILQIMKMWDIDRASCIAIARQMVRIAEATSDQNWTNPLEGTGIRVPRLEERKLNG